MMRTRRSGSIPAPGGVAAVGVVLLLLASGLATGAAGSPSASPPFGTGGVGLPGPGGAPALAASTVLGVGALRQAPLAPVADQEPGLDVPGATYVGPADFVTAADPLGTTGILISLAFSNATGLSELLAGISNSSSPQYRHDLTHGEFDARFGGDPAIYSALVAYLGSFGVTGMVTHPDRASLSFQADPAQVEEVFGTTLSDYLTGSGWPFFAPTAAPTLPAPLAPFIAEVQGLSNYSEYLTHVDSQLVRVPLAPAPSSPDPGARPAGASPASAGLAVAPGGTQNPFSSTTVGGLAYDKPVVDTDATSCSSTICGELVEGPDLQVTYNESALFGTYGYPVNATVVALLWSDTVCTSSTSTCGRDGDTNSYCSSSSSSSYAWDFFMPDVASFWNYTLPAGEPMPRAVSMPVSGSSSYAYPAGSQGATAACDSGGAEGENTLDVAMEGSMAPGANVLQVFGEGSTTATLTTAFSDVLSPTASAFSTTGGFDTALDRADLNNTSVIANSWTSSGSLGTGWFDDLEEAQALGITVLGSSGDSGGDAIAPPAENAYNAWGVVAVGGTTVGVNASTLARTAAHVASMASPYDGVGGGEIVWYAPKGTVDGFSSVEGTVGGVAAASTQYAPTWQNASSDAHGVITGITASGYGRGEPDISASANDTPIDLEDGDYSFNITCLVSSSCARVSSLGPSSVTVTATYFVGTSISDQLAGGEIAVVDSVLYRMGEGRLGFLDPAAYALGELEDEGDLALRAFTDITVYHNAEPTSTYGAFAGWDADTGWGTIAAGNLTQDVVAYPIAFSESGLAAGTNWSVSVTPRIGDPGCVVSGSACSNARTLSSTTAKIALSEPYGNYGYTIGTVAGATPEAVSGTFRIAGGEAGVSVTFSPASPAAPTGLSATAVSATAVNLTWTNPSGNLTNTYLSGYNGSSCSGTPFYDYHVGSPTTRFSWTSLSPSTSYSWEVAAVSAGGEGPESACASATTDAVPAAPTSLTATATSASAVDLSWSNPGGTLTGNSVNGYDGGSCSGSPFYEFGTSSAVTSFAWTALSASTAYSWTVSAVSADGTGAPSGCASATTLGVPSSPTGLSAAAASATAVNLTWTNPSGTLTNTYLWGYNGSSCSGSPFYDFHVGYPVAAFEWTSLSAATTYSFTVAAVSANGPSAPSGCASAATSSPPGAPTGLSATAASGTAINLTWTNPSGTLTDTYLSGYNGSSCSGSPFYDFHAGRSVATFVWTSLAPGATYSFTVSAVSAAGAGSPSGCASATTLTVPGAPTGLSAAAASATAINLTWTNPSGSLTNTYLSAFNGSSCGGGAFYTYHDGASVAAFHWTGLSPSTSYSFTVSAVSAAGAGSPSGCASATTDGVPAAPTNLTASAVSASAVNLSWSNPSGSLTDTHLYGFDGGTCTGSPFYAFDVGSVVSVFQWTSLAAGTTYSWEVTASSAYGESSRSGCASATTP